MFKHCFHTLLELRDRIIEEVNHICNGSIQNDLNRMLVLLIAIMGKLFFKLDKHKIVYTLIKSNIKSKLLYYLLYYTLVIIVPQNCEGLVYSTVPCTTDT